MVQKLNSGAVRGVLHWFQALAITGSVVYAFWGFEDRVTSLIARQVIAAEGRGEVARLEAQIELVRQLQKLDQHIVLLQRNAETLALAMRDHEARIRTIENRR